MCTFWVWSRVFFAGALFHARVMLCKGPFHSFHTGLARSNSVSILWILKNVQHEPSAAKSELIELRTGFFQSMSRLTALSSGELQAMPAILRRYNIYISKTAEFFGLTRTREIYEEAINVLPEARVRDISSARACTADPRILRW